MNRNKRQKEIIEAHQAYLDWATELGERAHRQLEELEKIDGRDKDKILKIKYFMNHAWRQMDQTDRRVIQVKRFLIKKKYFPFLNLMPNGPVKEKRGCRWNEVSWWASLKINIALCFITG